ncbi:acyl-CoA carboxylase subunit epsilon [Rhodococcoides yunnanense]|uniref:acyl-CoA carboxylase subunit epsilon n=1 Tax=Rhodococcoides yunnanense TaxID=278209 RepID=UPI0009FE1F20|nr:acyl-CoA carboxylase subunit epsilon [Rhodococcus yunnanensis]
MSGEANQDTVSEASNDTASELLAAIRVVKGNPSDEEIAALVTVLAAASASSSTPAEKRPTELWGTPASMHRTHPPFSPYSYAASQRY